MPIYLEVRTRAHLYRSTSGAGRRTVAARTQWCWLLVLLVAVLGAASADGQTTQSTATVRDPIADATDPSVNGTGLDIRSATAVYRSTGRLTLKVTFAGPVSSAKTATGQGKLAALIGDTDCNHILLTVRGDLAPATDGGAGLEKPGPAGDLHLGTVKVTGDVYTLKVRSRALAGLQPKCLVVETSVGSQIVNTITDITKFGKFTSTVTNAQTAVDQ